MTMKGQILETTDENIERPLSEQEPLNCFKAQGLEKTYKYTNSNFHCII